MISGVLKVHRGGESFGHCFTRTEEGALGQYGAAAVALNGIFSAASAVASAPNTISATVPLSPELFRAEGVFGQATFNSSYMEAVAFEAVTVERTLPASAFVTAQKLAPQIFKISPYVTAVAVGIELGVALDCTH